MKIYLKTKVSLPMPKDSVEVLSLFNRNLFEALSPHFPQIEIENFEGSFPGNLIALKLNFFLFKTHWHSRITERKESAKISYFVDEGVKLPFFLKFWRHQHIAEKIDPKTFWIIDEVDYQTGNIVSDFFLYPAFYFQFIMRKPVYKRYFKLL